MPSKKNTTGRSLATTTAPSRVEGAVRVLPATGEVVRIDAEYRVPAVHPVNPGPWIAEADKLAWTDAVTGYACIVRRAAGSGHLAGYVAVPPTHPLFGTRTTALVGLHITVHNGLSYAAACEDHDLAGRLRDESRSICHVPMSLARQYPGQVLHRVEGDGSHSDDAWWFGFECNGPTDILPHGTGERPQPRPLAGVIDPAYRDEAFVMEEVGRLALQLKWIEEGRDPVEAVAPRSLDRDPSRREPGR